MILKFSLKTKTTITHLLKQVKQENKKILSSFSKTLNNFDCVTLVSKVTQT